MLKMTFVWKKGVYWRNCVCIQHAVSLNLYCGIQIVIPYNTPSLVRKN